MEHEELLYLGVGHSYSKPRKPAVVPVVALLRCHNNRYAGQEAKAASPSPKEHIETTVWDSPLSTRKMVFAELHIDTAGLKNLIQAEYRVAG